MKIYPVNIDPKDHNKWCGPAAISILTGMTTGESARIIRSINGGRPVKGTECWEISRALRLCNLGMYPKGLDTPSPTLAQWFKSSAKMRSAGRVFLVSAGWHWQVVSGRRFCCSVTQEIVGLKHEKVSRRARVEAVYEIKLCAGAKKIKRPPAAVKTKPKVDPAYAQLRKLVKQHGMSGRLERDGEWEDYTIKPCALFPDGFQTFHHGDWYETLDRVETCIETPSLVVRGYYGR